MKGYLASQFAVDMRHEPYLAKPLGAAMASRAGPVVDVGVNKGQTLLRILSIDPDREYVGFEPQAACCVMAQLFIKDNALRNATVVGVALSDGDCLLPFYADGSYDEMASLDVQSRGRYANAVTPQFVPARKGDGALQDLNVLAPAIIKVDVEGAELSVFKGLSETIARARPICFFEVLPNYMGEERKAIDDQIAAANRENATAIFQFFKAAGYRIHQIDPEGKELPIEAFDLDNPDTFLGSDYVAHPL
ncbi:MAG: FkbM family methyltransferase [Novosphingobium sp.]